MRRSTLALALLLLIAPGSVEAFVSPSLAQGRGCSGDMAAIPPGIYTMGSKTTESTVAAFCLDRTEVVTSDYRACVTAGECSDKGLSCPYGNYPRSDREDHPINCVDWKQAVAFCAWRGKRLPTEEEWEWAARGGSLALRNSFAPGMTSGTLFCASIGTTMRDGTCAVRTYPATPFGLYDIAGNVWEWTSTKKENPSLSQPYYVWRGGAGWATTSEPNVALRYDAEITFQHGGVGFRCAKSLL